ncbi:MAG: TIGR03663 family protein [Anaerolineae bacterium]|nr:TIGR03663 family protein [Anaerolineae bacterium]
MTKPNDKHLLDKPLTSWFQFNWETTAYALIVLVAIISRFWDLGARTISHDESLHALYSYKLYAGEGYIHNPMMHGPFLFHANALIYFLFGVNDYTARIVPAIFGVALVLLPLLLRKELGRWGALVASLMFLISPSILYYSRYIRNDVYMVVWAMLMVIALFRFMDDRRNRWLYLGTVATVLSLCTKETAFIFGFIAITFMALVVLWEVVGERRAIWLYVALTALTLVTGTLALVLRRSAALSAASGPTFAQRAAPLLALSAGIFLAALVSVPLMSGRRRPFLSSVGTLQWWPLVSCLILGAIIFSLLYTTFLTNPGGLYTGTVYAVRYWLAQQDVKRGGQPWFYYGLLLPMYEFLPLLFGLGAMAYYLITGRVRRAEAEDEDAAEKGGNGSPYFVAFAVYWTVTSVVIYSWAGEKMPWLVVHLAQPFIILAARFIGDVLERADWRTIVRRGGVVLALLLVLVLFAAITLVAVVPFQGMSIWDLQDTAQWLAALAVGIGLAAIAVRYGRQVGWQGSRQVAFATALILLSLFTVRFSYMASFINYDTAKELLVYAHGGPDVKRVMNEIAEISRRTVGDDTSIKVAYSSDATWPFEWYLRDYSNRVFFGTNPTREALDAPVVIVGREEWTKAEPFLKDRYYRFEGHLIWWPVQDYFTLTPQVIIDHLRDPELRKEWWDILFYRKRKQTLAEWSPAHNFAFYVRKDVANQLWDYGVGPTAAIELPEDPYAAKKVEAQAIAVWGTEGSEPGQFRDPRGIAVAPDGTVYVADAGNNRIQKFDAEGTLLKQWGEQGNGVGQFQEPWGIGVGPDGSVYVADTWNHRIQKFDADGNFLLMWGEFGQTTVASGYESFFWGPRDVVVDSSGLVYVTDTGNKRVQVFDANGRFVAQFGGLGVLEGKMDEPVGLALDAEGHLYVADTWNQRVQVFDKDFRFLKQWSVNAWIGQGVNNKPYLAVDSGGRVYITDPEGYRVLVFSGDGEILAALGEYGFDNRSFSLPTGIALDAKDNIYVTDTAGHRVMKFAPLQ